MKNEQDQTTSVANDETREERIDAPEQPREDGAIETVAGKTTSYQGIRGANAAARLSKFADESGRQGLPEMHVPKIDLPEDESGAGEDKGEDGETLGRYARVSAGPAAVTGLGDLVDGSALRTSGEAKAMAIEPRETTPVANIFEAAKQAQTTPRTPQPAGSPAGMPGLPGAGGPQPPMPLDQARAQAFSLRVPTRRPMNSAAMAGPGFAPQAAPSPGQSNLSSFFGFFFSLFRKNPMEQTADRTFWQMFMDFIQGKSRGAVGARSMTMQQQSLFTALDAPLSGLTPDDIQYAGDVDAAYSRRPKFGARFLSIATISFFFIIVLWAALSEIDEVTHSEGSVVGSQSTQTISNLEGGILRAMLVRDGSTVQKGDVIAQIDNEMAASSYRDAMQRSIDNVFALIRLEAELHDQEPIFPQDLYAWAVEYFGRDVDASIMQQAQQIVRDQVSLWRSRKERFEVDDQVLQNQVIQREREIQEQTTHREQLIQSLDLAKQQRDAASDLLSRNNFSRLEYLNMEQRVVELQGQIDMLGASISRAQAAEAEARHRIESHTAEFRNSITEEINKRRVELTTLQETLAAGGDRVTRTDVRSPVRGIIKQIYINTIGGVIKPGEPILDIVPLDDTLLVEARVRPQDVAFLRPGQDVMVKVTAYDFSIYGGLEGKLEQISADTIEDKQGEFYYLVKIRTNKTYLEHNNEILPIIPGMIVQADILIGKKTILQYIMKPILKAKQNALTER